MNKKVKISDRDISWPKTIVQRCFLFPILFPISQISSGQNPIANCSRVGPLNQCEFSDPTPPYVPLIQFSQL